MNNDLFDEYKNFTRNDKGIVYLKEKVNKIITSKNLSAVMNDTKWLELQNAVYELPFLPPFIAKRVTDEDSYSIGILPLVPHYLGDWTNYYEEGMPPFLDIEWIKVRPVFGKYRGRLVEDEIIDETEQFIEILKKHSIPYEEDNGFITIYGYK